MVEKRKFMVCRVLFLFAVHIQQGYLTGETPPGVLLEERNVNISK